MRIGCRIGSCFRNFLAIHTFNEQEYFASNLSFCSPHYVNTMNNQNQIDVESCAAEYQSRYPHFEAFTALSYGLITELLKSKNIKYQSVEFRTKTVESFREKIQRPGKSYQNPVVELTDLCGLRVILYTQEDVQSVCQLIEQEFEVDSDNSMDKRRELKPNEFGYLSIHFIVSLSQRRARLLEYRNYAGVKLEIQVRTVLQHAWAAVDHRLRYKSDTDAPEHLRRRLFLLSGLFELADREFSELVSGSEQYAQKVEQEISEQNLAIPINVASLSYYVDDGAAVQRVLAIAVSKGIELLDVTDSIDNDYVEDLISDLSYFCHFAGLETLKDFEACLQSREPELHDYFTLCRQLSEQAYPVYLLIFIIWLEAGPILTTDELIARGWGHEYSKKLLQLIQAFRRRTTVRQQPTLNVLG